MHTDGLLWGVTQAELSGEPVPVPIPVPVSAPAAGKLAELTVEIERLTALAV